MEMKLELIMVPVSDVDRAKAFYTEKLGFHADFDQRVNPTLCFCPAHTSWFRLLDSYRGGNYRRAARSVAGLQMVVANAQEVHDELVKRGAEVSEIEVLAWGSFIYFSDPDGNKWAIQQLPARN